MLERHMNGDNKRVILDFRSNGERVEEVNNTPEEAAVFFLSFGLPIGIFDRVVWKIRLIVKIFCM